MLTLTADQLTRLPKNVARASMPPRPTDWRVCDKLASLLERAVLDLNALEADPIILAASPSRWNDGGYSDWRALRFGTFFTEEPTYFSLPYNYDRDLANGPPGARAAHRVLEGLEAANWRDLFSNAFGVGFGTHILALAIQDGIPWLVFSASFNPQEESHVFALWGEHPLAYFGECIERFDWEIQEEKLPPLRFQEAE